LLITLTCVLIFVCFQILGVDFYSYLSIVKKNQPISLGEPWRFFTPSLLHFSLIQLAFNLSWWWIVASRIEINLSSLKLINLFLISSLISNMCQFYFINNFGGLAGVIYALIGYSWVSGKISPQKGLYLETPLFNFSLIWLGISYLEIFSFSVAYPMLISGLITGGIMALIDRK